ncbi:GntR family transcriptional regulator [Siculibacillus lacustris]|uniref:GntR family transcriptional regulator n=1 Tax=Siculibacillus lacustris TaxID=1549641 RepID=A0A4Q9VUT7_9HYPH|nr:GntR family transcriptional regulator [Siculibacillus lacustris]TBW39456.1 GntR family transcriptional regulator [Siculibacillus lacustris]
MAILKPMAADDQRGSATNRVQTAVREAIINLELAPGSMIDKAALCERFDVSRFPVSDALARLQTEGLVEVLPQRGTRVSRIRVSDVRQAMFIRRALEVEMVRTLTATMPDSVLDQLDLNIQYQRLAVERVEPKVFHELDLAFHNLMLDCLGYQRVNTAIDSARASLERARRMLSSPRRHADTLAEHEAIFRALAARDAVAAAEAMQNHVDTVLAELMALMALQPEVFDQGS